jgi:hypothetical protein
LGGKAASEEVGEATRLAACACPSTHNQSPPHATQARRPLLYRIRRTGSGGPSLYIRRRQEKQPDIRLTQTDPALLRPDLGYDVTGGIQTRDLNSVIRAGR